jgi:ubiquinone/menaquinone biosynthesis C-methylase UbiE
VISKRLLNSVVCVTPACRAQEGGAPSLQREQGHLRCPRCGHTYDLRPEGYLDLMPREAKGSLHTSLYVSHADRFAHALDYRRVGLPLLGAGVRQRAILRMLRPEAQDRLIELGCGNGKFLVWNRRRVGWAVGVDPAPLFSEQALASVDLCQADARALPFRDGSFTAALSIDVLEHLPMPDIHRYLSEAHRVLIPGGRLFIFSNTREGSRLDFIVRNTRRLSRWLGKHGLIDDTRDRLRKSDHVKAIRTFEELEEALSEHGFRMERVLFWNGLFQSVIENLLVKLVESLLRGWRSRSRSRSRSNSRLDGGGAVATGQVVPAGEDELRSSVRRTLARRGYAYRAAALLTDLMWLDVVLFGRWRAGPYFLIAVREGTHTL